MTNAQIYLMRKRFKKIKKKIFFLKTLNVALIAGITTYILVKLYS